jgi:hypothetical protein
MRACLAPRASNPSGLLFLFCVQLEKTALYDLHLAHKGKVRPSMQFTYQITQYGLKPLAQEWDARAQPPHLMWFSIRYMPSF